MFTNRWFRALLVLAVLEVLGAVAGFVFGDPAASPAFARIIPRLPVHFVSLLVFAAGGGLLLVTGRGDRRAVCLGTFFLLLAAPYSNRWLLVLIGSAPRPLGQLALVLRNVQVDSFLPYFFWLFVRDFPRTSHSYRMRRLLRLGALGSLLIGIALFARELARLAPVVDELFTAQDLVALAPPKPSYGHYGPLMVLTILGLVTLLWKARSATGDERRRAGLFAAALAIAPVPLFSHIVLGYLFQDYQSFVEKGAVSQLRAAIVQGFFVSLPFTTAYAVLVHKVLDVKLVARQAIRYALARGSALALIALPVVALIGYFLRHGDRPVSDLFSGNRLLLLALAAAGAAALYFRAPLLEAIDRRFFREQYSSRRILTVLVHDLRAVSDADDLAELICRELDRALHLESAAVLVEDPRSGTFADPHTRSRRRLDASSPLALLVADGSDPLDTELEGRPSTVTRLPEDDRRWLADQGIKLITPIPASDGSLLGMILLGAKKSGLPFLQDDRQLLRDIANSAAMGIELSRIRQEVTEKQATKGDDGQPVSTVATPPKTENARECPHCGRVYLSYTVLCTHCSRKLEPAQIPYVLPPNRFRFERRIGAGGMGVVYRASDLSLGRPVAIKTLRKVSPDHALRLRREARTAAAVVHPHLASIYGVDTWQTTPMLILELLEGGTLGQRIEKGVLSPLETVELGIAMAGALERLHGADILHRDVKPNNIGFTRDGVPKLMDFGIARMVLDSRTEPGPASGSSDWMEVVDDQVVTWVWGVPGDPQTRSRQLVGTLSYLCPEALEGEPASPLFDLWGLAVVLYECLIGRKLFRGDEVKQVMARIIMGRVPDLTDVRPDAPEALARFFRTALHRDSDRRPQTATALREKLLEVKAELAS